MDEKEVSEMQEEMMTVLVVEPMKAPYVKSIPNELEDYAQVIRDIVYHPMIEYPLELPEAMVVYPKLCECHLSEQVRKAPQKVRTWNVSRTDIRRMMARGNAAIKKMQKQGTKAPEAVRSVRKGTVR